MIELIQPSTSSNKLQHLTINSDYFSSEVGIGSISNYSCRSHCFSIYLFTIKSYQSHLQESFKLKNS